MLTDTPEYQAFVRFLDLTLEARQLRERLNEILPQIKALQPALLGYLGAAGLPSLPVGEYSLYSHREPWVYPGQGITRQSVCDALKAAGLARMVKENYSTQSLTAYVKDLEAHARLVAGLNAKLEAILPPPLARVLAVKPAFSIRVRHQGPSPIFDYEPSTEREEANESE